MTPNAKALLETIGAELLTGQALLDHNDPEQAQLDAGGDPLAILKPLPENN